MENIDSIHVIQKKSKDGSEENLLFTDFSRRVYAVHCHWSDSGSGFCQSCWNGSCCIKKANYVHACAWYLFIYLLNQGLDLRSYG